MKKKLLLVVAMMALLCCLFAVSASAKHAYTPHTEESLSSLDVTIILTDGTNEFNATMKFKDLFNYSLTTDSYALKLSGIKATTITVDETEYTLKTSMVGIYFPDGTTHLNTDFMKNYSTVFSKAYLPDSIEFIGDCVFYKCGTFSLINEDGTLDKFLPENLTEIGTVDNWGNGVDHFFSGCTLQNNILVFPEGLTSFNGQHSFNDGYSNPSELHLVFLGKMTAIDITSYPKSNGIFLYFAQNDASDVKILAGGSECNTVETRLINDEWCYAYANSITGVDLSTTTDNTGKSLTIKIANADPNSETNLSSAIEGKNWRKVSSIARKFYFCSGEMILTMRNGTFGYKVYISDPIATDDVHPFDDGGATVEPTCTIGGGTRYSCGVCGAFLRLEDATAEALGHDYTEEDIVASTPLTCTQDKTTTYACKRCNEQFVVIHEEAQGHIHSIVTYPVEATFNSLGTKRMTCENCDDFVEFTYRLDPGDDMVKVVLGDGSEFFIKASEIFKYTFDETAQTANISDIKDASFTIGDVKFNTSDIYSLRVPFGFTGFGRVSNRNIEVMDFSLTDGLTIGSEAFRDNHSIEWVILGNNISILGDAFRCPLSFKGLIVADGANVVFPISTTIFNDIRSDVEFIIGKNATVHFVKENFTAGNVDARLINFEIGDGATVVFGKSSFNYLTTLTSIKIGENCNLTFGEYSFEGSTSLESLIFPASTTVTLASNAFKNCTALTTISLPASTTAIPSNTFVGCAALSKVVLMGATSIGESAFNATSDAPLTIYAHATGDLTLGSNALANRANVILYTNSKNITSLSNATYTIYVGIAHAHNPYTEAETCFENGYIGYVTDCPCGDIAYGVSYTVYTNEDTEGTAGKLDEITIIDEFDGHDIVITVTYENGYDQDGLKCTNCSRNCGTTWESFTTKPIIIHKGYSYNISGAISGIQSGFHVEIDALNEYNLYNEDLKIGLAILNPKYLGDSFFNGANINAEKGCLQVDVTTLDYSEISCMISFPQNSSLDTLELVIFAYIFEGDSATPAQLIQKQYAENELSAAVSKVTKGDTALHTVNLTQVKAPVAYPADPEEYVPEA